VIKADILKTGDSQPDEGNMKVMVKQKLMAAAFAAAAGMLMTAASARADSPLHDAISLTKPLLDMRLRDEFVDQDPLARDANAVTLRTRAGFETGKAWGTSLLAEIEWVLPLSGGYNDTINGRTRFPTVADPRALGVNRLQLTNISLLPSTAITLGRQRINLDDQRFVGNVGWRQNEQTFDALRVVNKSIDGLTLDGTYFRRANRVFGNFSPQGHYNGDNYLVNTSYQFPLGKLTAFAYLLQFDQAIAVRDSSQTYGARFAGTKEVNGVKLTYAASYATQKDYDNNPLNYSTDYYLVDVAAAYQQFSAGAGYEVMGGDGIKGFTTPLATLHKFDGWADKFLTTPPNGIEDLYFSAGYTERNVGPFATMGAMVAYHRFNAEQISQHYGNELNAQLQAKWQRYTFTLKFADYDADRFATDTQKVWFQVEFTL
jgi:hypothetical protein